MANNIYRLQNKKVSKNINSNLIFYSLFVECVIVSFKLFFSYGVVFPGKGLGLYLFFQRKFYKKKYTIPCCQVQRVRYEIYVDQLLYCHVNTMYLSFYSFQMKKKIWEIIKVWKKPKCIWIKHSYVFFKYLVAIK